MKNFFVKAYRWEYFFLVVIVVATLALHFAIINQVNDLILDEQHYVKDARVIIEQHQTDRPEHPPLGKLMIVSGMEIFGDNPWGWRIFPDIYSARRLSCCSIFCAAGWICPARRPPSPLSCWLLKI